MCFERLTHKASAFRRGALKPSWLDDFNVAAEQYLERQEVEVIHELYKLGDSGLPNTEPGLTQFISDVRFYLPVVLMRMAAPKSADLRIYHLLEVGDVTYLHQNISFRRGD